LAIDLCFCSAARRHVLSAGGYGLVGFAFCRDEKECLLPRGGPLKLIGDISRLLFA